MERGEQQPALFRACFGCKSCGLVLSAKEHFDEARNKAGDRKWLSCLTALAKDLGID